MQNILNNIIVNIAILMIIGYVLPRFSLFRKTVFEHKKKWSDILILSMIFGGIGILSTYTGIRINGAIANTRVIGVIAGGFLGGPWVGLLSGLIAGLHRWSIDINGFTAFSCAISTVLEGIIGGLMYKVIRSSKKKYYWIFLATFVAEVIQMLVILILAHPFSDAVALVKVISIPMVFLNSIGVVIFVNGIFNVKDTLDRQNASHLKLAFDIADLCLPFLRRGLQDQESMSAACSIIFKNIDSTCVMITDNQSAIAYAGLDVSASPAFARCFDLVYKRVYQQKASIILNEGEVTHFALENYAKRMMFSPILRNEEVVGLIIFCDNRFKDNIGPDLGFINGLSRLFSSQLALAEMDNQGKLLQKAELRALQSQINPHFLFNALNTISAYTRESPDRARQLLLSLSSYFRNTLSTHNEWVDIQEEIEHVLSYVEIEKARFEERLVVNIRCLPSVHCRVPNFVIQPLIENAIKHGMTQSILQVDVTIEERRNGLNIVIQDNGCGIPQAKIDIFYQGKADKGKIGMANIHQRLKSIYPNNIGLVIHSKLNHGTTIQMFLPKGGMAV